MPKVAFILERNGETSTINLSKNQIVMNASSSKYLRNCDSLYRRMAVLEVTVVNSVKNKISSLSSVAIFTRA